MDYKTLKEMYKNAGNKNNKIIMDIVDFGKLLLDKEARKNIKLMSPKEMRTTRHFANIKISGNNLQIFVYELKGRTK